MHIENAKTLISELERLPDEKFDMRSYVQHGECGTTACIAGWICLLHDGPDYNTWEPFSAEVAFNFARNFLGLTDAEAVKLFLTHMQWTRADAVAELKRMVQETEAVESMKKFESNFR